MTINDENRMVSSSEDAALINSMNEELQESPSNVAAPEFQICQLGEQANIANDVEGEELTDGAEEL